MVGYVASGFSRTEAIARDKCNLACEGPNPKMPDRSDRFHFVSDKGDARLRLDLILLRRVTHVSRLSRNVAQQWIESGAVTADGVPVLRPAARLREGAAVEVRLPPSTVRRSRPAAEAATLEILYEDDVLIVVNKPAGIVVHPSYKQLSGTLLNALLWRVRDRIGLQPGIVTRLDKDTSGLVLVALTPAVHAAVQRDAAAGVVEKSYLALVRGTPRPRQGRIRRPLARDPNDRRRMVVAEGGAECETRYEVLSDQTSPDGRESLVRCELLTGRTHQIRVHLASKGWPIVGDRTYGQSDVRIGRQALHAWRLSFPHPVTRRTIEVEAPLPQDLEKLVGGWVAG
jgi:23S rRNA pseudouridine1911/1915/1917 synthase